MTKAKSEDNPIRVLATGTCDTITGSSRLTYEIGTEPEGGIQLCIARNSGGGFYSDKWIGSEDIQQALRKKPARKAITSILLHPLFQGKSVNTLAFLLAVLLHEKIVRPVPGKLRRHALVDSSAFKAKVEKTTSLKHWISSLPGTSRMTSLWTP
jgi:hypothetical protein